MITKKEKERIVILAEKGKNYFEIAEAIVLARIPGILIDLNSEVTDYLEGLEEKVQWGGKVK